MNNAYGSRPGCSCVIDISTPATLERDFNLWLNPRCDYNMNNEVSYYSPERHEVKDKKSKRKSTPRKGTGTNLYGRPYCPGRPLSMAERTQIIELHNQGMKVNAISKQLCISHGCVSKIISRFRDTGLLSPASNPDHRRPRRSKKPPIGGSTPSRPPVSSPPLSYMDEMTTHTVSQLDVTSSSAYLQPGH